MNKMFILVSTLLLIPTASCAERSIFHGKKTNVTLSIATKCKSSSFSYHCFGPIKFEKAKLPQWNKDSALNSFYVLTNTSDNKSFQDHESMRIDFLAKACPDGFGLTFQRTMMTCTDSGGEQEIKFIYDGDISWDYWTAICNATGSAEVLKTIYPLATWVETPKMSHLYDTNYTSFELKKAFKELKEKLPQGCRQRDCRSEDCGI